MSEVRTVLPADAPPATDTPSLTHATADGALWVMISTGLTRVLTIAAQLVLARLLVPDDFGLVWLTQFVVGVATFLGTLSLTQFLITRQRRIKRYAGPAFWVSVGLGLVGSILLVLSAPVAARVYLDPRLIGLLLFCAATFPLNAAVVVPLSMAQIQLRFKLVALVALVSMVAQVIASVIAAWAGAGAYSIFIGLAAASVVRLASLWWLLDLRFPCRPRAGFRVEKLVLAQTSFWVVGVGLFGNIIAQGDYATMGLFFTIKQVGYYGFAYGLAQQAVLLLGTSLGGVLFPAIARLAGDPQRQRAALMRAVRMLTLIGAPGGLLMFFLMPPIVHAFGAKWLPAIPIAQVMAIGAVGVLVSGPAAALMTAQERYRIYFFTTLLQTALFLSLVVLGCFSGEVLGVAAAVSVYFWIGGPLGLVIALDGWRVRGESVKDVLAAIGIPTLWSLPALAGGAAVYFGLSSDGSFRADLVRSLLAAAVFAVIVLPTLYLAMRPACQELLQIGRAVAGRLPGMNRLGVLKV